MSVTSSYGVTVTPISATRSSATPINVTTSGITLNSATSMSVTPSSVTTSSVTLRSVTLNSNQTRTVSFTPEAAPTPTNVPTPNSNRISGLQRQVWIKINLHSIGLIRSHYLPRRGGEDFPHGTDRRFFYGLKRGLKGFNWNWNFGKFSLGKWIWVSGTGTGNRKQINCRTGTEIWKIRKAIG